MTRNWGLLLGAAFLMATSAIGPGFLTQTTVFTEKLGASFGFVILMSILLDIGAQLNIWRVIAVSEKRAQDIANDVLPGLGYILAALIAMGGLAFNIGNVAGAGLGVNVLLGLDVKTGAVISALIAIGIFLVREAGKAMDRFAQIMGFVMIALTLYVAVVSGPPVGEAVVKTFWPDTVDALAIVTLVGGTVGGYITFAGGHRLLDAGLRGPDALPQVTRSAVSGILIASVMRVILFLAALGVVAQGLALNPDNPPASVFQHAAGTIGYKLFGMVMWAAAATSIVGAAYTSVSFLRSFHRSLDRHHRWVIIAFILISTLVFVAVGRPVKVLILVGALNGLILPLALSVILVAAYQQRIVGAYRHPLWMTVFGGLVVIAMAYLGVKTLIAEISKLLQ
ncbi:divalent metal cation transporter [Calditerricola satsumensis]|uniref:Putative membrane protein YcsG n=2 Tax=Calditerricola satsumensis TaxID=373054 RepID=A0A8J3F941_9BACI|nr:putative membrane protein YcsG [Calditerricola satsumensis]